MNQYTLKFRITINYIGKYSVIILQNYEFDPVFSIKKKKRCSDFLFYVGTHKRKL